MPRCFCIGIGKYCACANPKKIFDSLAAIREIDTRNILYLEALKKETLSAWGIFIQKMPAFIIPAHPLPQAGHRSAAFIAQ